MEFKTPSLPHDCIVWHYLPRDAIALEQAQAEKQPERKTAHRKPPNPRLTATDVIARFHSIL